MRKTTLDDLEKFLGKIIFEIAYMPTKEEAIRLLKNLRIERKNVIRKKIARRR